MTHLIASGLYHVVLGSRILGKGALAGGMPLIKYIANRGLTFFQNIMMNAKLSEYHTGYRAFSREVLGKVNYNANSDNFVFDNQMLAQIIYAGYEVAEITCPTKYFDDASSINLKNSTIYGIGVIKTSLQYRLQKWKWIIPFFILPDWKRKLTFLASGIVLFFVIAFPVTLQIETFWGWIKNLVIHSGQYGKGDTNWLDLSAFKMNLKELFYYEKNYFYLLFGLIATFVAYLIIQHKKAGKRVIIIVLAVILTVFIQLVLVGKHYAHRYFIPVLMLSPLMVLLIAEMIRNIWRHKAAVYFIHTGIVLFLLWQININHHWLSVKSDALSKDIENRLPTWHFASLLDTKKNYLFIASQSYGSPFIEYTLTYSHVWGNLKKRIEYAPILDKLYPFTFNYFPWDNSLRSWVEPFDVTNIRTSGKLVYLYMESDNEELYSRFLEKLRTESDTDFSADRELLYKNHATSEVIYLWTFKLPEPDQ
jgi:hypothetical protein